MGMFTSFDINASGMTAQRFRMDIISENVANANTTRTSDGSPYSSFVIITIILCYKIMPRFSVSCYVAFYALSKLPWKLVIKCIKPIMPIIFLISMVQ